MTATASPTEAVTTATPPTTPPAGGTPPSSQAPDWRSSLPAELQSHDALKSFKGVDELAKGYISAQDWRGSLPDDLKKATTLEKFKTPADLAKSYVELEPKISAKGLIKPGKDAKPEELAAFYNALGRPETADKYQVPTENMPDGVQIDPELTKSFFTEAHQIGLTDQQAAAAIRWQANMVAQSQKAISEQQEAQKNQSLEALRKEWGAAYDERLNLAKAGAKQYFGDKYAEVLGAFGNDPAILQGLSKIGRELAGDEIKGGGHSRQFTATPAESLAMANDIISSKSNPDHEAYYKHNHPNHAAIVEKVNRLFQVGFPEQPKS